jgi:hypothetical protein
MPSVPWPSLQSLIRATILALLAFLLWELLGADTVHAVL